LILVPAGVLEMTPASKRLIARDIAIWARIHELARSCGATRAPSFAQQVAADIRRRAAMSAIQRAALAGKRGGR
jgi:hypothetical protein